MQATLTTSPRSRALASAALPSSEARQPAPVHAEAAAQAVDSSALLRGQKAVAISHNGAVYRLQATRLGKLILTK